MKKLADNLAAFTVYLGVLVVLALSWMIVRTEPPADPAQPILTTREQLNHVRAEVDSLGERLDELESIYGGAPWDASRPLSID